MEISLDDITQAFLLQVDPADHSFAEHFKSWDAYSIEDIILNKIEYVEQTTIYQTFALLKHRLQANEPTIRLSGLNELAVILNYQSLKLFTAYQNNDLKPLLIFLEINGYLKAPLSQYIGMEEISYEQKKVIIESVSRIVRIFNLELDLPPNSPFYEKELLGKYKQGVIDGNLLDVYNLIDSIERSGRGIRTTHRIINLLQFLFEIAMNDFLEFLYQLKAPHMLVAAIQWMSTVQLTTVALTYSSGNKWLHFELLRQVFKKYQKEEIGENEAKTASNILYRLYQQDNIFFSQAYWYFERSISFSKSFGKMLPLLSNDQVRLFVNENFLFRQYNHYFEGKTVMLHEFMNSADTDLQKTLLSCVYQKWKTFLDSLLMQEDFHTLSPELTDYANYILAYLEDFVDSDDRVQLWNTALMNINSVDTHWYNDSGSRSTRFMLLFSKLYLYTLSLSQGGTKTLEHNQKQQLEVLFLNPIFNKRYFRSSQLQYTFNISELVQDISNKFDIKTLPLK